MLRVLLACSIFALALAGCSESTTAPSTGDVVLVPTRSAYAPGAMVSAQLFNRSEDRIGYGACSTRLEHRTGSQWVLIGPEEVPCIDVLYALEAGGTTTLEISLDPTLEFGVYRLRQEFLPQTQLPAQMIRSPEFEIRATIR